MAFKSFKFVLGVDQIHVMNQTFATSSQNFILTLFLRKLVNFPLVNTQVIRFLSKKEHYYCYKNVFEKIKK